MAKARLGTLRLYVPASVDPGRPSRPGSDLTLPGRVPSAKGAPRGTREEASRQRPKPERGQSCSVKDLPGSRAEKSATAPGSAGQVGRVRASGCGCRQGHGPSALPASQAEGKARGAAGTPYASCLRPLFSPQPHAPNGGPNVCPEDRGAGEPGEVGPPTLSQPRSRPGPSPP